MEGEKLARRYSIREERLNFWTHVSGVILFLATGWKLFYHNELINGKAFFLAQIFYWFALIFMFGASALYHLLKSEKAKQYGRKFDHCAIYILITGTYAPLMTGVLADWRGYTVLGTLLVLTVAGIVIKFCCAGQFHKLEVALYLLMGWLCMLVIKPLIAGFDPTGFKLLVAGGVTYTAGVIFYAIRKEFCHAVWHLFVLAGAWLQFMAVLTVR